MWLAYVFALVAALGVLLVQIVMAGHGDAGHGASYGGGGHGHGDHPTDGGSGIWTLLLSLRFWVFAALGFGLSGTLIHLFGLAPPLATFLIATSAGLCSGLFAALAFRAVRTGSTGTENRSSQAVGKVGRVIVTCGRGIKGQVRVELAGSSVDLVATTDEETIARGEPALVEDVRDGVAHVSRPPGELDALK